MASIRPRARSPGRHAWSSHHNHSQGRPSSPPSPRPSAASSLAAALARALCLSSRKPSRRRPPLARLLLLFLALGFIIGFCELGLRSRYGYLPDGRSTVIDLPSSASISQIPPPDHDPRAFRLAGVELEAVRHEDGIVAVELEARKEEEEEVGDRIRRMPPPELSRLEGAVQVPLSDDSHGSLGLPLLIVVTPTYNRALQAYFLTRLAQTLRLVPPPLVWIVVESGAASPETAEVLRGTGVMYRHLVSRHNSTSVKDRGVHQRNAALEHIERHQMDGVVYFADDDNIYSLRLFQQLREIRRFGTWPVAMLAQSKNKATMEGPVCNGSQVIGWHTNEKSKRLRRFHVDMSGFAFNSTILWDLKRWRHLSSDPIRQMDTVKEGFQETTFIEQVVEDESQMEAVPSGCSMIMNWHLHLDAHRLVYPRGWRLQKNLEVVIPLK